MKADVSRESISRRPFPRMAVLVPAIAVAWAPLLGAPQDGPGLDELAQAYRPNIEPLLDRYCHKCHSGAEAEAEIDLAAFATMADVRREPEVWVKVREMLDSHQMPPKEKKQPTDGERAQLQAWVRAYLTIEAQAHAGDPGPLVLRRLSNAEYNYTVRDLTGVASLDPTQEFPVDGAAGEGFTNSGAAQGMSPALVTKYLDAAKAVAAHAVLTPDGIRFSQHTTRRDRTNALLAGIQAFYRQFTEDGGGSAVNLQGIKFETNQGGRLPLARYLAATLAEREALASGTKTIEAVAKERNLSAKYLGTLWKTLSADNPEDGSLIAGLRTRWSATTSADPSKLVAEITQAQKDMWKFNSIGHIGREGGPSRWMEAVGPRISIATQQPFKWRLPDAPDGRDVVFYLATSDAGDGNDGDYVVWKNFRLEGGGRPPLPLRDVAGLQQRIDAQRQKMLAHTADYLAAAAAVGAQNDAAKIAKAHKVDPEMLDVWLDYLAIGTGGGVKVEGHFTEKLQKAGDRAFINGWGSHQTPSVIANSSDQDARIPGLAKAHSVVAHPSPTLFVAVGWQSPIDGVVRVEASVTDAHHDCGNGVEWFLQHQTAGKTGTLWQGDFEVRGSATMTPTTIAVRKGEVLALMIGPRQGNHSCDLTAIQLVVSEAGGAKRAWDLAKDVSEDILAANPHPDRHGNLSTWHFYKGEMAKIHQGGSPIVAVPPGSLLAQWLAEKNASDRAALARRVQALATGPALGDADSPDAFLRR